MRPMHGIPFRPSALCRASLLMLASSYKPPAVGSIHSGIVRALADYGAFVTIDGLAKDGLVHISQLDPSGGRVDAASNMVGVGDRLRVKVLRVDDGKISLSCRSIQQGAQAPTAMRLWVPAAVLGAPPDAEALERLDCVTFTYSRSSGAGGQNVNKLNTNCEARLQVDQSPWAEAVKARLRSRGGVSTAGVLSTVSDRHRTQSTNRKDALEKLAAQVKEAWLPPTVRKQRTGPSHKAKRKRSDEKRKVAQKKQSRSAARRGAFDWRAIVDGVIGAIVGGADLHCHWHWPSPQRPYARATPPAVREGMPCFSS